MGNSKSIQSKASFEDVQHAIKNTNSHLLINTLSSLKQECLITNTILATDEEKIINHLINKGHFTVHIIIYGENANDETVNQKQTQFLSIGFQNVYVYSGGFFEWLLLGEIYGLDEFPRTKAKCDILKYKPRKALGIPLIEY